jgi:hypothetical protein
MGFRASSPGITVRKAAPLPFAYDRQSIALEKVLQKKMDARAIRREDAPRAFCPRM